MNNFKLTKDWREKIKCAYHKAAKSCRGAGKHTDLVRRRIIFQETIPHDEKIFSLFEPYTEWIKKGKIRNQVELGLRIAIATDQYDFILGYRVMQQEQDVDIAVPFAKELLSQYNIDSISFDKGFWSPTNYNRLAA